MYIRSVDWFDNLSLSKQELEKETEAMYIHLEWNLVDAIIVKVEKFNSSFYILDTYMITLDGCLLSAIHMIVS